MIFSLNFFSLERDSHSHFDDNVNTENEMVKWINSTLKALHVARQKV